MLSLASFLVVPGPSPKEQADTSIAISIDSDDEKEYNVLNSHSSGTNNIIVLDSDDDDGDSSQQNYIGNSTFMNQRKRSWLKDDDDAINILVDSNSKSHLAKKKIKLDGSSSSSNHVDSNCKESGSKDDEGYSMVFDISDQKYVRVPKKSKGFDTNRKSHVAKNIEIDDLSSPSKDFGEKDDDSIMVFDISDQKYVRIPKPSKNFASKPSKDFHRFSKPPNDFDLNSEPSNDFTRTTKRSKDFAQFSETMENLDYFVDFEIWELLQEKPQKTGFTSKEFDKMLANLTAIFPLVPIELVMKDLSSQFNDDAVSSIDVAMQRAMDKIAHTNEKFVKEKLDKIRAKLLSLFPWLTSYEIEKELLKHCSPGNAVLDDHAYFLMVKKFTAEEESLLEVIKKEAKAAKFRRICIEFSKLHKLSASERQHFDHVVSCSSKDINMGPLKVYKVEYIWNAELEERYSKAKEAYEKQGRKVFECSVFHGTDDVAVEKIIVEGFKIGGKGVRIKNGDNHGTGVYTATYPSYSLDYSINEYGQRTNKVLLCVAMLATTDSKNLLTQNSRHKPKATRNYNQSADIFVFNNISDVVPRYIIHYK